MGLFHDVKADLKSSNFFRISVAVTIFLVIMGLTAGIIFNLFQGNWGRVEKISLSKMDMIPFPPVHIRTTSLQDTISWVNCQKGNGMHINTLNTTCGSSQGGQYSCVRLQVTDMAINADNGNNKIACSINYTCTVCDDLALVTETVTLVDDAARMPVYVIRNHAVMVLFQVDLFYDKVDALNALVTNPPQPGYRLAYSRGVVGDTITPGLLHRVGLPPSDFLIAYEIPTFYVKTFSKATNYTSWMVLADIGGFLFVMKVIKYALMKLISNFVKNDSIVLAGRY